MRTTDTTAGAAGSGSARTWIRFGVSLAFGLALFILLVIRLGVDDPGRIGSVHAGWLIVLFASTLAMSFTVALRWSWVIRGMTRASPAVLDLTLFFTLSRLASYVLPKDVGDFAVRAAALRVHSNYPMKHGLYSVLIDRVFDLMTVLAFLTAALVIMLCHLSPCAAVVVWVAAPASLLVLGAIFQHPAIAMLLGAVNGAVRMAACLPRVGSRIGRLTLPPDEVRFLKDPGVLVRMLACSILKFLLNALRFIALAKALSLSLSPGDVLLATPVAQSAYIIAFTPAALGIFEGGWAAVLTALMVPAHDISLFLIGQRVYILAGLLAGLLLLAILRALLGSRPARLHSERSNLW